MNTLDDARRLQMTKTVAAAKMNEVKAMFKDGAKLTLLVRIPGNDEADFLLTDDQIDEAIKVLTRRRDAVQ